MEKSHIPGDGVVTGWGTVNGRTVFVFSKDFTVFGGSLSGAHAAKMTKIQDMALKARAPIIGLFDAVAPESRRRRCARWLRRSLQAKCDRFGRHSADLADHGPLRRRRRLFARMTDFIFMVKDTSYMFVTGPDVVKTVTNEVVTSEELGGASVHAVKSSVADGAYENDLEALLQMRRLIDFLPSNNTEGVPEIPSFDQPDRIDMSGHAGPDNPNKPYDMKELIAKTVDEGDFFEIQGKFAQNIITGFARIEGRDRRHRRQPAHGAGRRARQRRASRKAARFVRFCDAFSIPIVTFVGRAGLPARDLAGIWRPHQARRQAALRLHAVHGAAGHRHHPQGLRRRL